MENTTSFLPMFFLTTVLLFTGVIADNRGCGSCRRTEICTLGRCRPRSIQTSIPRSILEQNVPREIFPQLIPSGILIQAAQFGTDQQNRYPDLMVAGGPTGRRPLIVSGHPSLLSQLSALPLMASAGVALGLTEDVEDRGTRQIIPNRRRQQERLVIVDNSDVLATPLAHHESILSATEAPLGPPPLPISDSVRNEDESDTTSVFGQDATRPLHDHTSNPDKHFNFEDAWTYPWRADDTTDQIVDDINTEEVLDVVNVDNSSEDDTGELNSPDIPADDISLVGDLEDADIKVEGDNDVTEVELDTIADGMEEDVSEEDTPENLNMDDDVNIEDSESPLLDENEDEVDEQETPDSSQEQTELDSENDDTGSVADMAMEETVVGDGEVDDHMEADVDDVMVADAGDAFDTWADSDYENMKSVVMDKTVETKEILQSNEANSMSSFNGQREDSKEEDGEESKASVYAFASVPVALIIVAGGVVFLCCYWSRIKSKLRQQKQGKSPWLDSRIPTDNQTRKASSSSCTSLISTRPRGKMSVVSVCDTIAEEREIQGVASLAEKTKALENTYVDIDDVFRDGPRVSRMKEEEIETLKGVSDREYAEIGMICRPTLPIERTISVSTEHTYIESIDDIAPPSYREVVYNSNA